MRKVTSPEPPKGLARAASQLPVWIYRARLGVVFGHRLVLINHVGRKSGRTFRTVVDVVTCDRAADEVTVVSGYGRSSHWFQNLLAHPDVTIVLGSRDLDVRAVEVEPEAAAQIVSDFAKRRPRYAKTFAKFMGYEVDGTDADYRAMGAEVSMIRFEPRA